MLPSDVVTFAIAIIIWTCVVRSLKMIVLFQIVNPQFYSLALCRQQ